jgi:hypothetical protein
MRRRVDLIVMARRASNYPVQATTVTWSEHLSLNTSNLSWDLASASTKYKEIEITCNQVNFTADAAVQILTINFPSSCRDEG